MTPPDFTFAYEDLECIFFINSISGMIQCFVDEIKQENGTHFYYAKDYKGNPLLFRFQDIHGRGYIPKQEFCYKKAKELNTSPLIIGTQMQAVMEDLIKEIKPEELLSLDKICVDDFKR